MTSNSCFHQLPHQELTLDPGCCCCPFFGSSRESFYGLGLLECLPACWLLSFSSFLNPTAVEAEAVLWFVLSSP